MIPLLLLQVAGGGDTDDYFDQGVDGIAPRSSVRRSTRLQRGQ